MLLPNMKYQESAYQQEVVPFLGINYADNFRSGELSMCQNLSIDRYPYLSVRKPRKGELYASPSAIFSWDGKLILVDGTSLIYDGETVGTVSAGEKQFAVVNTKLCIWPDGAYLDLVSREFGQLGASVQATTGTKEFTENTITMTGEYAARTQEIRSSYQSGTYADCKLTKRYTSVSWSQSGGWVLSGEEEVKITPVVTGMPSLEQLAVNDLVMLSDSQISGNYSLNTRQYSKDLDSGEASYGSYAENSSKGYYAKITKIEQSQMGFDNVTIFTMTVTFTVLNGANTGLDMTCVFAPGDRVRVEGCTKQPENNTPDGTYLTLEAVEEKKLTFAGTPFTAASETARFTVSRDLPELDYVCESENRLWGVSNAHKTIYCSALGDPKNFFAFDGLSTDSYAVAVGSEGDFSGICRYGNAVLCWKEHSLHKILGSYPAEFQMATYQYTGVRIGAYKSIVNLNEVLFYLGPDGVYAFSGGSPTLISRNFGQTLFSSGVGGTDKSRYWLSYQSLLGEWSLVVYDPSTGLWLREDDSHVLDFCRMGDRLLFLSGNTVYTMGTGDEAVEWEARFTPFYETVTGRKRYSRLFLRAELPKGSWLKAEMRCDGGRWESCGKLVGGVSDTQVLPLIPNRCDRFEIRLTGKGACAVLSMLREFRVGGAV